jgi:hypothetical protein
MSAGLPALGDHGFPGLAAQQQQAVELSVKPSGPAPHARFVQLLQPSVAKPRRVDPDPRRGDGSGAVDGLDSTHDLRRVPNQGHIASDDFSQRAQPCGMMIDGFQCTE